MLKERGSQCKLHKCVASKVNVRAKEVSTSGGDKNMRRPSKRIPCDVFHALKTIPEIAVMSSENSRPFGHFAMHALDSALLHRAILT